MDEVRVIATRLKPFELDGSDSTLVKSHPRSDGDPGSVGIDQ